MPKSSQNVPMSLILKQEREDRQREHSCSSGRMLLMKEKKYFPSDEQQQRVSNRGVAIIDHTI